MWNTKTFTTRQEMDKWILNNKNVYQWEEIFVNNAYGVTYRKLHVILFD